MAFREGERERDREREESREGFRSGFFRVALRGSALPPRDARSIPPIAPCCCLDSHLGSSMSSVDDVLDARGRPQARERRRRRAAKCNRRRWKSFGAPVQPLKKKKLATGTRSQKHLRGGLRCAIRALRPRNDVVSTSRTGGVAASRELVPRLPGANSRGRRRRR